MVKTGLDNIKLSKMCPTFLGGTDRTCEPFNNYLVMETVQVPIYNNFFPHYDVNCLRVGASLFIFESPRPNTVPDYYVRLLNEQVTRTFLINSN